MKSLCSHLTLTLVLGLSTLLHAQDRPNIVFLFTDDHAPHAIGAYNGWLKSVNPTPNIDQLAAEGMLFENSFCTNSICGPSRAVILTGKHSHKNGFMNNGKTLTGTSRPFPSCSAKPATRPPFMVSGTSSANRKALMNGWCSRGKDSTTTPISGLPRGK